MFEICFIYTKCFSVTLYALVPRDHRRMAEKSLSHAEQDHGRDKVCIKKNVSVSVSSAVSSAVSPAVLSSVSSAVSPAVSSAVQSRYSRLKSSVHVTSFDDSSSEDDVNVDEASRLRQHQKSIGKVSYASAAAALDSEIIKVSLPDINSGFGRPRPRTVFVHGSIGPRMLIEKLEKSNIVPQQVQSLLSSDIAVTFKSVADKQRFLNLDCVISSEFSVQRPVWVRIHFKPAELKADIVKDRLREFGTIIFFRENRIIGTDVLSGSLTAKMKLRQQIPSFLYFGPLCLAVNYDGQPPTCRKCDNPGHIAKVCQVKRCFNCGKSGHLNRQCPDPAKCQGCSSLDHCFEQCPSSWVREEESEPLGDAHVEVQDNFFENEAAVLPDKSWSSQVEDALKEFPVDSKIWSPLLAERIEESSAEPLSQDGASQSDGCSLVIDESVAVDEESVAVDEESVAVDESLTSSLKRSHDTEESSFVTVSRRRPSKKKIKESK